MTLEVANRLDEAAGNMMQAAEKLEKVVKMQIEMNGMLAENEQRRLLNQSMAFTNEDFMSLLK